MNVSNENVTVNIIAHQYDGTVADQNLGFVLTPLSRNFVVGPGADLWCEVVVVSSGSAKDLRGNMVVYSGSVVTAIEPAREK